MKHKKIENQIRALLSMQVKLEQMKLDDGVTIVEAESFEPEYSIGIVTEEGIVPMPVGEYAMEDGRLLKVEVEGVIASIEEKAAEEEKVEGTPDTVVEPDMAAQPKKIVESVSKETFFAEMEKRNKKIRELNMLSTELNVSAYIELPLGVHVIAGDTITVEEVEKEGVDGETYKQNVITSIVKGVDEKQSNSSDNQELSSQDAGAEAIVPNPESGIEPQVIKMATRKPETIQDRINRKLFS